MNKKDQHAVRFWHARFWYGMSLPVWLKVLKDHQFKVERPHWWQYFLITPISIFNLIVSWLAHLWRRNDNRLPRDPIFVIGHWRSGTTLLHELMMLNEEYVAPTTLQCMAPNTYEFLDYLVPALPFLVPKRRPMDNMELGWHSPQEDEFALLNLGEASPYTKIGFPHAPRQEGLLSLRSISPERRRSWQGTLRMFLANIWVQHLRKKPDAQYLVVKSPTHTARIQTLLEIYPDAKFLLITRAPEAVFGSTVKLWRKLGDNMGFQDGQPADEEERVLLDFEEMMGALAQDLSSIPQGNFHQMTYEELLANPRETMGQSFDALGLSKPALYDSAIEQYFAQRSNYKADRYALTPDQQKQIDTRWVPILAEITKADAARKA